VRYCVLLSLLFLTLFSLGQSGTKQEAAQHKSDATQITQPKVSPIPEQPVSSEQKNKSEQQPPKCPLPPWTDPFWSNWALVVVTVLAVWAAFKTLGDLKEQTAAAQNAAEEAKRSAGFAQNAVMVSERADILLEGASILPSASEVIDGDARLVLRYKNFGRTRAKDARFKAEMFIEGVTLTSAETALPVMTVGAGQDRMIGFQSFRECLTQITFMQILEGKIKLWFVASVVYEDVFGASYTTRDVGTFDPRALIFRVEDKIAG
jgi:hypothetical protein